MLKSILVSQWIDPHPCPSRPPKGVVPKQKPMWRWEVRSESASAQKNGPLKRRGRSASGQRFLRAVRSGPGPEKKGSNTFSVLRRVPALAAVQGLWKVHVLAIGEDQGEALPQATRRVGGESPSAPWSRCCQRLFGANKRGT